MANPNQAEFSGGFIFGRSEAKEVSDLPRESVINAYRIDATLVKEADGEWRFTTASHRVVNPAELF